METKQELIKVTTNSLGEMAVSARELYEFLEVKTQFTKWCERMFEYGFEKNKDYFFVSQKRLTAQGNETTFIDYALTLDTSKEISMLQRTEKGKQARKYFLDCEKELKQNLKPLSTLDYLEISLKQMKQQETRLNSVENKILQIEAKTTTRPEYFTVMGFAILSGVKIGLSLAAQIGLKAKDICI